MKFQANVYDMEKISIEKAYSSEPWWYDIRGFLILTFAYRSTLLSQIRLFSQNIRDPHLEIAIGSGTLFGLILKWRKWKGLPEKKIIGIDYAEQMLGGARKRFFKSPYITLVKADAAKLPFDSNFFESANIANAIHCLPQIAESLQETHRVLKSGGLLTGNCLLYPKGKSFFDAMATKINAWGAKKGILNHPYSKEEICNLLQSAGFEIQFEEISGNCYNFIQKNERINKRLFYRKFCLTESTF